MFLFDSSMDVFNFNFFFLSLSHFVYPKTIAWKLMNIIIELKVKKILRSKRPLSWWVMFSHLIRSYILTQTAHPSSWISHLMIQLLSSLKSHEEVKAKEMFLLVKIQVYIKAKIIVLLFNILTPKKLMKKYLTNVSVGVRFENRIILKITFNHLIINWYLLIIE